MKRTLTSIALATLLASIFLLTAHSTMAQEKAGSNITEPEFSGQNACFTSGSGDTFMKVCISKHGNITWLESPQGLVHLKMREGYVACSGPDEYTPIPHGFDAGITEDGWGAPQITQPNGAGKLPLVITRNTTDGKLQLKQTLNVNPALREVTIKMDFKNISDSPLENVYVARYFDGDIDGNGDDDIYDLTYDSVTAKDAFVFGETNYDHRGLMLTLASIAAPNQGVPFSSVEPFTTWDPLQNSYQDARTCGSVNLSGITPPGDYVGRLEKFLGTINKGAIKSVTFIYKRF